MEQKLFDPVKKLEIASVKPIIAREYMESSFKKEMKYKKFMRKK